MTPAQRHLYLSLWSRAVDANHWHTHKGVAVIDESRLTEQGRQVVDMATRRSIATGGRLNLNALRHAVHICALGRDKSSKDFTNAQFDHVIDWLLLLIDGDDLDALMRLDNPTLGEEKRIDYAIEHAAPDEYTRAIAGDKFGSRQWEGFTVLAKRQLLLTLRARRAAKEQPIDQPF